jgi:hypothetical protein
MEAQALRDGVQHVVIKMDAQEVMKLMEDPGGRLEIAGICQEIRSSVSLLLVLNLCILGGSVIPIIVLI